MFDFEKLKVYDKSKIYNALISEFLNTCDLDKVTKDQLHRASLSIILNIAEGSGRFTNRDKRHFYIISRGSAYECVAIFDYLKLINHIELSEFKKFYEKLEELSKMLFAMIKKLEN